MRHLRIYESLIQEQQPPVPSAKNSAIESKRAQQTKRMANFFNKLYKINLPLDGNPMNKEYMKAFGRFCQEQKILTYTCKKGDGYCNDAHAGELTIKDDPAAWAKFNKMVKVKALELLMKP